MTEEIMQAGNGTIAALGAKMGGAIDRAGAFVAMRNPDSVEAKVAIYNATVSSERLRDHVGEAIDVAGVMVKPDVVEVDGERHESYMAVIIDSQGRGFMSHSAGVVNALGNILATFGTPEEWPDGMRLVPIEETSRRGFKFVTLKISF